MPFEVHPEARYEEERPCPTTSTRRWPAQNGQLYIDDLYVFPGEAGTVLMMDVNSTITGPHVRAGFHPEARYEFKVHIDGARLRR